MDKPFKNTRICIAMIYAIASCISTLGCSGLSLSGRKGPYYAIGKDNPYAITVAQLESFKSSVRPIDGEAELRYRVGLFFQKRNKHAQAIDEFKQALHKNPLHIAAYNALGVSYDKLGEYENALKNYEGALKINPNADYVHNNMGYSLLLQGRPNEAINEFQKAISINSANRRYLNNLSLARYECDRIQGPFPIREGTSNNDDPQNVVSDGVDAVGRLPEQMVASETVNNPESGTDIKSAVLNKNNNYVEPDSFPWANWNYTEGKDFSIDAMTSNITTFTPLNPDLPYTIEIINGNGINGMARRLGAYLEANGYKIAHLSNAEHFGHMETKIYYPKGSYEYACRLIKTIPGYGTSDNLIETDLHGEQIRILLGKDLIYADELISGRFPVEIINGNGVNGIARRLAAFFIQKKVLPKARLTNADHFSHRKTKICYGKGKRQSAIYLAGELPGISIQPVIEMVPKTNGVKILVGRDLVF